MIHISLNYAFLFKNKNKNKTNITIKEILSCILMLGEIQYIIDLIDDIKYK